jgi:hypothetical protein
MSVPPTYSKIVVGTDPICSCCWKAVSDADIQVVFVRDAFEKGVSPPDAFSRNCMRAVKRLMTNRELASLSKIIYFCKACLPAFNIGAAS